MAGLGYTPVQQGGGAGQGTDKLYLGYNAGPPGTLRLQINSTDFGANWPINITGNAATASAATTATNATSATNSSQLGGIGAAEYLKRTTTDVIGLGWNGSIMVFTVNGNSFGGVTPMNIAGNAATATTATNANALGGVAAASYAQYTSGKILSCEGPRDVGTIGRAIPNLDNRVDYFNVGGGSGMVVNIDGTDYGWAVSISDERLKTNIRPTQIDSVTDISAIEFAAFDFRDDAVLFVRGKRRSLGVIAQQVEKIRADWVMQEGEYKQLDTEAMLMSAMHAIQQQGRTIAALIARVEALEAAK